MHHEDGAHGVAAGFSDGFLAPDDRRVARHALDLGGQRADLFFGKQVFQQEKAVALILPDLFAGQGVGVLAVAIDHRVLAGNDGGAPVRTGGVRILCR